ncbi:MAG TPA: Nif3-like dinuclear metal center hexameric protein [Bacteroidia bacterium]|nr:Nif3-like dinuclear metal center hexameric protein [Bacteroidia bacterium]HNR48218.1 Nif3-like dinuclear metal center hexameric protein [Bacteroidia bacterium]HNT81213.1 Nif3-like dinuclear metal center hexameric protein [Bacteroidia bacterium]
MTLIKDVIRILEDFAPPVWQESYDNSGLITGNPDAEVTGIILCLDSIESVIDEAISENCNLVIAHHPIVFSGIRKLTGKNYIERTLLKAIRNNISIYAIHTNLDNVLSGVNHRLGTELGLRDLKILSAKEHLLKKLVTFCPVAQAEEVRNALFEAGAGGIGNYSECSFNVEGTGTFKPGENTNPFSGKIGVRQHEKEVRIESLFYAHQQAKILNALFKAHPYEEVAYYINTLDNSLQTTGSGMTGILEKPMDEKEFLLAVKSHLGCSVLRHTSFTGKKIEKVALCGGAGFFLLKDAIAAGADAFITSDIKYHQFFDADNRILLVDAGHFETEQFTMNLLKDLLIKNFSTFAIRLTKVDTNPVKYI